MMVLALVALTAQAQQATDMARGADVSWCTEMEAASRKFYNANGQERELMALMKEIGMTAIRLRVWVNPSQYGYGAWSDKTDVVAKAKRAKAAGLDLMIDFHYSDFFADPSRQDTPVDWQGKSLEEMKTAVANHTKDVLNALKDEGIEPKWVQVGNETNQGMVWDSGKIDWNKSGNARYTNYVALSNAGYDAVKDVFPNAYVIVHHDKAHENPAWFFKEFKAAGGNYDMIGLSHYPDYDNWSANNISAASSVKSMGNALNVPVMIVETGYDSWSATRASEVMTDLMTRMKEIPQCAGVFYWEPEVDGQWKPDYYKTISWDAYKKGAFTAISADGKQLKPTAALDAFGAGTSSVGTMLLDGKQEPAKCYDLSGRPIRSSYKGVTIERRGTEVRKVLQ